MKKPLLSLAVFCAVFVIGVIGAIAFVLTFATDWSMNVLEYDSPTGYGTAIFVAESRFPDYYRDRYFVRDPALRDSARKEELLLLGEVDESIRKPEIIWSRDGTVMAVFAEKYSSDGNKNYGPIYAMSYDFKKHKAIRYSGLTWNWNNSTTIQWLLYTRGGKRPAKLSSEHEVGIWKWDRERKQYNSQDTR